MKKRRLGLVALLSAVAVTLSGCALPYESQVVEGTTITVANNQAFDNYNSGSSAGNAVKNAIITYMTNSGFQYYDNTPALIKDTGFGTFEKISDEPLTVAYTINEGVQWSDGTQIDAADMLLSWAAGSGKFADTDAAFSPASTSGLDLVTQTPEISSDGRTLTLVYDAPYVDWELAFGVGMPAHGTVMLAYPKITDPAEAKQALIEAVQNEDTTWLAPVAERWNNAYKFTSLPSDPLKYLSSGPYIIEEIVADQYITLVSNPVYAWGPSPKFERITVRFIADFIAQLQALENGEVDIITGQPTADSLAVAQGIAASTGATIHQGDEAVYEHVDLTFNNGGPFDAATYGGDAAKAQKVRQAFLLTIPRDEIIDKLIKPLNPNATVRESFLTIPGSERYNAIVAASGVADVRNLDIDRAKALLAEAGVSTPVDVKFWYPTGNVRRSQELELIQKSAALAGFNVIDDNEPDWMFTDPDTNPVNPHDAVIFAWASSSLAVAGSDQIFASYDDPTAKAGNYNGYGNPKVDGLLAELNITTDLEKQTALMLEIETNLVADAYGTTIFQFPGLTVSSSKVTGVKPSPLVPNYFWNFWEWELVTESE
jgi:peptide/nickel transport system substrate-binding protein